MIRKSIYSIEQILPLIKNSEKANLDGDVVNVGSLRLMNFKVHGLTCVTCGLTGSFFAKEKTRKDKTYHLNLYAVRDGAEILMTQDHIVPISLNGKNSLDNVQTMCTKCNCEKGNGLQISRQKVDPSSLLNSSDKELKRAVTYLKTQLERGICTVEDLNILVRLMNKTICLSLPTSKLKEVQEGTEIRNFDSRQSDFIDIGNNVVIAHNARQDERCNSFYIFNKESRERLQIQVK